LVIYHSDIDDFMHFVAVIHTDLTTDSLKSGDFKKTSE